MKETWHKLRTENTVSTLRCTRPNWTRHRWQNSPSCQSGAFSDRNIASDSFSVGKENPNNNDAGILGQILLRSQRRKIREYILVNNDKQQTRFMTLFWGQLQWSSIRSTRVSWHQNNQLWIWLPYGVASGGTAHSTTRADDVLKHASRQHYRNSTLKLSR